MKVLKALLKDLRNKFKKQEFYLKSNVGKGMKNLLLKENANQKQRVKDEFNFLGD